MTEFIEFTHLYGIQILSILGSVLIRWRERKIAMKFSLDAI